MKGIIQQKDQGTEKARQLTGVHLDGTKIGDQVAASVQSTIPTTLNSRITGKELAELMLDVHTAPKQCMSRIELALTRNFQKHHEELDAMVECSVTLARSKELKSIDSHLPTLSAQEL